jgi:hypothetical protein
MMTNSRSIRAGGSPARASSRAPRKLKKYRVLCSVTRSEWYEIMAPDEETARRTAFCEGELVKDGDTMDVTECDVEEVQS